MSTSVQTVDTDAVIRRRMTIQGALPILARAIGRQAEVEVQIGGSEAAVRGRLIQLPALPFGDPEVETLAFGYIELQAALVRHSDAVETTGPMHDRLCKILDEVRCQRALGQDYPGFAIDLSRLTTKLVRDRKLARPRQEDPAGTKLCQYLAYRLRAEVLGHDGIGEYAAEAETLFRQAFPTGVCTRLGSIIGRVRSLQSSQDAVALAAEVLVMLKEESEEPPPAPPLTVPESSESSADQSPSGLASNDASDSGANGSTQDAESGSDAERRAMVRELLQDAAPALGPEFTTIVEGSLQKEASKAVKKSGGGAGGFGRADPPKDPPAGDPEQILLEVNQESLALRTRLRTLVESVKCSRRTYRRHGTRLSASRLVPAMLGDLRIFERKRLGIDVNTAFEFLCDRSGSMSGDRMCIAAHSTLAAISGLGAIRGVAAETALFPGVHAEVEVLTGFQQPLRATATRYKMVRASGGTPMYEALMWGFERLLMREEPRKILVCLTDGKPPAITNDACRQCIDAAMAGGIEVYAIGIQVPDITTLFPVARSIDDISGLPQAMFEVLQHALVGPRTV